MKRGLLGNLGGLFVLALILGAARPAPAAEMAVEATKEAAPADKISAEIAAELAETGWTLGEGDKPTFEFWPVKKWAVKEGFKPTGEVLYPFTIGELVGVIRYNSREEDFRGQKISRGVYTVRYAQQPVDGNHVGTSDTRDFFLLLPADADQAPATMGEDEMWQTSAKAAKSNHPAMLCLLATPADATPGLVHIAERELTGVCFENPTTGDPLKVTLVLIGKSAE